MKEWKEIKNYKNYIISSMGEIKSLNKITFKNGKWHKFKRIKTLKPLMTRGYIGVRLYNLGENKKFQVHRLVALHFIPNPLNKPCINHKDGNKLNNSVNNLEWCTNYENTSHAIQKGLLKWSKGVYKNRGQNLKKTQVLEIYRLRKKENLKPIEIAKLFNVTGRRIGAILNGITWKHLYKYK